MYKCNNNLQPAIINERYQHTFNVHGYDTRNKSNFYLGNAKSNIKRFCLSNVGVKTFNKLPDKIKEANKLCNFRSRLKALLMENY